MSSSLPMGKPSILRNSGSCSLLRSSSVKWARRASSFSTAMPRQVTGTEGFCSSSSSESNKLVSFIFIILGFRLVSQLGLFAGGQTRRSWLLSFHDDPHLGRVLALGELIDVLIKTLFHLHWRGRAVHD